MTDLKPNPVESATSALRVAEARGVRRQGDGRLTPFSAVSFGLSLAFAVLALAPVIVVLLRLVFPDGRFDPTAIVQVVTERGLGPLLLSTSALVVAGGALAVIAGSVLAWLVTRTDAKVRGFGTILPLLPFLLPALVGTIGWTMLLSPKTGFINVWLRNILGLIGIEMTEGPLNIFTWGGMIFIYALFMTPFTFLLVSAGLENTDSQLEEQSRVSGAGLVRTLARVTIPSVRPSLGAAMLLTVFFGFAFFAGPVVLSTTAGIDVLSVRIVEMLSFSYPPDTGGAVGLSFFMLIAVAIAWYFQRRVLSRANYSTITGRGKSTEIELGRWRWVGRLIIFAYITLSTVLPVLVLLWIAIRGYWSSDFSLVDLNPFATFRNVLFEDALTTRAIQTSLMLAVVGATIGMLAAAIIARFVRTATGRMGRAVDVLIKVGAPIPAIVLAVGLLVGVGGEPFFLAGTFMILLLAYIGHFLPQATVNGDVAAAQVGPQLVEASHISGAGDGRTFMRISLPLMLPDLIAGWALLFLWMFGEFNASVILSGVNTPVVGLQMYNLYEQGFYGRLAALAIVVLVICTAVVAAATFIARLIRGGRPKVKG